MTTIEEANIRGLEIDKIIKAVTWKEYVFKSLCQVSSTKSDSIRWYNKTSAASTLSVTAPSATANISPLSPFTILESNVTRNTSYVRKYATRGFLSIEDVDGADIDMLALTVMDLTRHIISQVDSRIYNVLTGSDAIPTSTGINMITTSGAWTDGASNPIRDILEARRVIMVSGGYTQTPTLVLTAQDYSNLVSYLVFAKGSSIPQFASTLAQNGNVLELAGIPIRVSDNVTADKAVMLVPQVACTWKSFYDTSSVTIDHPGIGKEIRVWEEGEAILTNPKAVCLISNTQ